MNYYLEVLRRYNDFGGRSDRRQYWIFILVNFAISMAIATVERIILPESGILSGVYALFILIPGIAVAIRRLHDIGKSGWMQLVMFIPLIGWIWFLILMTREGEAGRNQYGESLRETRF